jgi:ABC-2 type transport system ATP-binding protein
VVFHLKLADDRLAEEIGRLSFVKSCKRLENKLVVSLNEPEAHNPEIVRLLVGLGADVQFVGEMKHSLEDVYLQLVENA